MIDLGTLLLLLAVADLMRAAALWLGASQRLRDGLSHWAGSLVVRALGLALLAGQGNFHGGALAVGAALLALSMTLQAAALLAFDRRPLATWIHTALIAAVAVPLQLLEPDRGTAVVFGGIVFGTILLVIAILAAQLQATVGSRGRVMLVACFATAGAACVLRGTGAVLQAMLVRSEDDIADQPGYRHIVRLSLMMPRDKPQR